MNRCRKTIVLALGVAAPLAVAGCSHGPYSSKGVKPLFSFPVTDNETPYSQCLAGLSKLPGDHLPTFAVGEVADKTGKIDYDTEGHALTQGVSEMVMSALYKSGKAQQVERFDLRIPLAEIKLAEQNRLSRQLSDYGQLPASDFVIVGALTELNYNIVSNGAELFVDGIGGGARTVVINVALDLRVVDAKNFGVRYVSSLQKQIYGYEIESNIFRFFGDTLVEFNAGEIKNEPLQLGVRSVVEMAVYQIMTEFLGLPGVKGCDLVRTGHMAGYLEQPAAKQGS